MFLYKLSIKQPIIQCTLLVLFHSCSNVICKLRPDAGNVCNSTQVVYDSVRNNDPQTHKVNYEGACGLISCSKTKEIKLNKISITTTARNVTVLSCCPGYNETADGYCVPVCSKGCAYGNCVGPNTCKCTNEPHGDTPGFVGKLCDIFTCPPLITSTDSQLRWGPKCDKNCSCLEGETCFAKNGTCVELDRADWTKLSVKARANVIEFIPSRSAELVSQTKQSESFFEHLSIFEMTLLNIILLAVLLPLIYTSIHLKRKIKAVQNELYQVAYSAPNSSYAGNSVYSETSNYSPNDSHGLPLPYSNIASGKTQNFNLATRTALFKGSQDQQCCNNESSSPRAQAIVNEKVENHLIKSQQTAQQNIYSDLDSNYRSDISSNYSQNEGRAVILPIDQQSTTMQQQSETNQKAKNDCIYQVPRIQDSPSTSRHSFNDSQSNIYEEIKFFEHATGSKKEHEDDDAKP